jgi:hypothetical protein
LIPALQVGGVQDAVTVPAPAAGELTVPTLPNTVPELFPETPTEVGFAALHVSGTPVIVWSAASLTVAFKIVEVPLFTTKDVFAGTLPAAAIEMLLTRQVSIEIGWLLNPPTDANT